MTIWIGEGAPRFWLRSHLALLSSSLPKVQTPHGRGRIRHIFLAEGAIGFSAHHSLPPGTACLPGRSDTCILFQRGGESQ